EPLFGPVVTDSSYGSVNVSSSLSPVLVAIAPWLTATLLLGATALLLTHLQRLAACRDPSSPSTKRLAQLDPPTLVGYSLLFLILFILGNKVFSPQYLVWLAPLVSLVPFPRKGRRLFLWTFAVTCLLTTVLFPFLFGSDLLQRSGSQDTFVKMTLQEPT